MKVGLSCERVTAELYIALFDPAIFTMGTSKKKQQKMKGTRGLVRLQRGVVMMILLLMMTRSTFGLVYNRTMSVSTTVESFQFYLSQIPSFATSCSIRLSCTNEICSYYVFDREQFMLFKETQGEEGTALIERIGVLPNTVQVLQILQTKQKQTFQHLYHGSLYLVVRNIGSSDTPITGVVSYVIYLPDWVIWLVTMGVVIAFGICTLSALLLVLLHMYRQTKKAELAHERLTLIPEGSYGTATDDTFSSYTSPGDFGDD